MRTLTKLFCTAFLLMAGFVSASAQEDEIIDLTADMFYTWNGYGADAVSTGAATVDFQLGVTLGGGGVVCGTSTVDYLTYADLTGCSKMQFVGTAGVQLRVLMNRQESNTGPLVEKNPTIGENGEAELDLTEFAYVHLNAIKVNWGGSGEITSIKLVKPSDPLAIDKEQLKSAINSAKLRSSYAKTTASWDALQKAITDAEDALNAAEATAESLTAAKTAVEEALAGLQLTVGYTNLTQEMFQTHSAQGEAGTGQAGCAYDLFKATGMPYGDGSVGWLNYADLTAYDKLIVVTAAGQPRFCMNRTADGAQDNDDPETSQFIDIPGHAWGTDAYQTQDGDNVWIIDLKKLVADRGIAYLHSIKGANFANVTVTDMLLYREMSYGIVGDLTGGWDADVEMTATEEDGIYTLTIEGFEAEAKTYEYKLRANEVWGIYELPASGNNNWTCKYPGKYTLVFTADVLNHSLDLEAINETPIDISIKPAAGTDIAAEFAAAKDGIANVGNILIELENGGNYTTSATIAAPGNLTIWGNDATIDASALNDPMFAMANVADPTDWTECDIEIAGIKVTGLKKALFFSTCKNYLINNFNVNYVNAQLAGDATTFDFTKGSAAVNFNVTNSTFYAPTATTKAFYSSQGGQKVTEAGDYTQTFKFQNNTMYNLTPTKNFFTHRQNSQTWLTYDVQNNIFVNCGKSGQVIAGMNGGGKSANPTWIIKGNLFNFNGEDTGAAETTGDEGEPVQDTLAGIVEFTDADNGDFNGTVVLDPDATVPESLGSPMWKLNIIKLNKYTATFTTNAGWEEVYAYAWSGDGETATKFLGDWPGTKLELNEETGLYDVIIKAEAAPEKIIFNSGKGAQTEDLVFEDGKAYEYTVEESTLMAEAETLAADPDGVAVGKLLAAIQEAKNTGNEDNLQAAIDQFKTDNLDQEKDETPKVDVDWQKWNGATGFATWAAPQVTTYDGRTTYVVENYNGGSGSVTGEIFSQTITGLATGDYKVAFFANANSTADRDTAVETGMEDGATDVAYVFANDAQEFIVAHRATSIEANGEYSFEMTLTEADNGTIKLGLGKAKAGTNWHTMQIKQLTWFTTAKAVYAADQNELSTLLAKAKDMVADENKTNGKEELSAAIAAGDEAATEKKTWYNIPELEEIINNLKAAMDNFKKANWFIEFAAGEYYIIDTESGYFMAAGHDYGTRGIINEIGLDLTLTPYEASRTVTINSRVSNGGNSHFLGNNLYMDGAEWGWALEYQGFGFYILEPNSNKYINIDESDNLVLSDTPREFIIVSKDGVYQERLEELEDATKDDPVDATFLLQNPNFNRNDLRVAAWQVSENCTNKNLNGGNNLNNCAESFHSLFTISQTVTGAPAGLYRLTAQGFYRQDQKEYKNEAGETVKEDIIEPAPVFFAKGATREVPAKTGSENSMSDASASFTNGLYTIEPIEFTVGEDGTFTVGIKNEEALYQWVIFDNFTLEYLGTDISIEKMGIVGDFADSWDPAMAMDMTQSTEDANVWTLEITDFEVTFEEGQTERTYEYKAVANEQFSYYDLPAEGNQNWHFAEGSDYPAGKYYLKFTANTNDHTLELEVMTMDAYTGISNIDADAKNAVVYNLKGQKVQKAQKGLYIINGKKMVVK